MSADARRGEQHGWYFYDFANSAFATTVLTLLFGPYIVGVAKAAAGADGLIRLFGVPVEPRSLWSYLVAASVMLQVIVLPVVGAVADTSARKKRLLGVCAYTGSAATIAMFLVSGSAYLIGAGLFLIANVAFGASMVVYNSFLPDIATPEERDAVSSKGWALGYLGGGIALALNLVLFAKAPALGLSESMAARVNLASAGLWWAGFSVIPLLRLRNRPPLGHRPPDNRVRATFAQLLRTLRGLRAYPETLTMLIAYLLYNDAVQAVIALAGQFGHDELKMPMSTLALAILMVQFVAFGGALAFNQVSRVLGTKPAVITGLLIWTATLVGIYSSVRTTAHFFIAAAVIGVVLGGTQALSRSLFSQMIPKGREAEYFSLYEISDKGTSWLAPLFFGLALQFTGSYRLAILSLIVFFLAGLIVLVRLDVQRGSAEAARAAQAA
ncbi:MAG: MFS transporter [Acidobacteria bacterium]|nr:MFS transporter [Acidobacteriota bacterium]